jgi:hypothetical protein
VAKEAELGATLGLRRAAQQRQRALLASMVDVRPGVERSEEETARGRRRMESEGDARRP